MDNNAYHYLQVGDTESEERHHLRPTGQVTRDMIHVHMGTVHSRHSVLRVGDKGASISFSFAVKPGGREAGRTPYVMEIEEIHIPGNAFGYMLYVEDTPVYFRTYEPKETAPHHYFIEVNTACFQGREQVNITIFSESHNEFAISRVWGYDDFYAGAERQGIYRKLGVDFFAKFPNAEMPQRLKGFSEYASFEIGAMLGWPLAGNNQAMMKETVSRLLEQAQATGTPYKLMAARWWSFSPKSQDGRGGYFSDLQYQQVVYNPITRGYQPTVPNRWSSTAWHTLNNEHYNQVGEQRAVQLAAYLADRLALELASGANLKPFNLVMEWGAGYWHASPTSGGDFSDETVAAAKRDGINLDPADGLSEVEVQWMYRNLARYNERLAHAYKKGFGPNSIVVDKGKITLPSYQWFDNLYTHVIEPHHYPAKYSRKSGIASGITNDSNFSAELYSFTDPSVYDYARSFGKLATVNLEGVMQTLSSFQDYLRHAYEAGEQFVCLFNPERVRGGMPTDETFRAIDQLENNPASRPLHYEPHLFDLNYTHDYRVDLLSRPGDNDVSYTNLTLDKTGYIHPSEPGEGIAIYKVFAARERGERLLLEVEGYTANGSAITVYAGHAPEQLAIVDEFMMGEKLTWFNRHSKHLMDLSEFIRSDDTFYVKIVLDAREDRTDASLHVVKVLVPWEQATGQQDGGLPGMKQRRMQNLWVQQRAVTERMLKAYKETHRHSNEVYNEAIMLYEKLEYRGAYQLLVAEVSRLLPARFALCGYGDLDNYPIHVQLPTNSDTAVVKLLHVSVEEIRFSIFTERAIDAAITIRQLPDGGWYKLSHGEDGAYVVRHVSAGVDGCHEVKGGKLVLLVHADVKTEAPLPSTLVGCALSVSESQLMVEVQDVEISHYDDAMTIPFAAGCVFTRASEGSDNGSSEKPMKHDKVSLVLNAAGQITEVKAEFGVDGGRLKTYTPPAVKGANKGNGSIELENGNRYAFSYNPDMTYVDTGEFKGLIKEIDFVSLQSLFNAGDLLQVTYCPYSFQGSMKRAIHITKEQN